MSSKTARSERLTPGDDIADHYILLCARRYAETLRKLRGGSNAAERAKYRRLLRYLIEAGIIEAEAERSKRERSLPDDIRKHVQRIEPLAAARVITAAEAALIRAAASVPPVADISNVSASELTALAEMYEGWAKDYRLGACEMALLLGWADGHRALVHVLGPDYEPLEKVPREPDSLLKLIARQAAGELS